MAMHMWCLAGGARVCLKVDGESLLCPRERECISGALRPRGIGKHGLPRAGRRARCAWTGGAGAHMRTQRVRVLGAEGGRAPARREKNPSGRHGA
jgi:hypothetical protein